MTGAHIPIETLRYALTRADAIAWEGLPRELNGWRAAAFIIWLALAGFVLAVMPENWLGPSSGVRFWAVGLGVVLLQYGIAVVFLSLMTHWRAARRVPALASVELERWGDHIVVRSNGSTRNIAPETIGRVHLTKTHIFLQMSRSDVVIIPASAFETDADMAAFAAVLDDAAEDADEGGTG